VTFGIVVFRCPDLEAARAVMQDDPAIRHGVMLGDLHPYRIAIQGRLETEEEGP